MSKEEKVPEYFVSLKMTKKKLTLEAGTEKLSLAITKNQEIDLIQLDMWISDILYKIHEAAKPKGKILLG